MIRYTAVATASKSTFEGTKAYSDATVTGATAHPVAAEYTYSTRNSTSTCSNHIGTALYETHVAGQEESGCVD